MLMAHVYKVPLVLTTQSEWAFAETSLTLSELIIEEDTVEEAIAHAQNTLLAVAELYEDLGRPFPLPRGQGW
jgi:hypothetical protein